MSVVFKYKNSLERAYAPGIADSGEDGLRGDKGIAGPCIYYVGYDLDNSYSINLALQKIENNILLSDESTAKLPGERKYKNQDLIISTSGQCYMLVDAPEGSTYSFNIKSIGQIARDDVNDPNPILRILFVVFSNEPEYFNTTYTFMQRTCVPPTNYERMTYNSTFNLDGIWVMPIIYTSEELNLDLKLYFNLEKELTKDKLPNETIDSSRIGSINFTKYLEFSDIKASILGNDASTVYFNPIYLSNMTLDKLTPNNKLEYTGVIDTNIEANSNLSFYQQGVDFNRNKTPNSVNYQLQFAEHSGTTYVNANNSNTIYVGIPNEPSDASYGTASSNPGIPAVSTLYQTQLMVECNNTLIKGTRLTEQDVYHAGTSEAWSKTTSVYEAFQEFSGAMTAEVSYTKFGRLYSYTINNIDFTTNEDHPEIFNETVLSTTAPYELIEEPNILFL